jgi:hypothetical protein
MKYASQVMTLKVAVLLLVFQSTGSTGLVADDNIPTSGARVMQVAPNSRDPSGIWSSSDIDPLSPSTQTSRAIAPEAKASIHEYTIDTPEGQLIVSQLWNGACSNTLCPTRVILVKPDGTRTLRLEDMLPQVDPQASKSPGAPPVFALSKDGKKLLQMRKDGVISEDLQ